MNTTHHYHYEIPTRLTVLLILFYLGLCAWMAYLAKGHAELRVLFIGLSVIFGTLALVVLIRRLAFPCTLELTDDAILLPCGHPWPRTTTIPYADIISIQVGGESVSINTCRGTFAIGDFQFEGYRAVREIISSRAAIPLEPLLGTGWDEFPKPLLEWVEPENWTRFLTRAEIGKPVFYQIGTELWFFARCYAFCFLFVVVPVVSFVLLIFGWEPFLTVALSIRPFVGASVLALIFTMLRFLYRIFPIRAEKISFRDRGITKRNPSGQLFVWNYRQLSGWTVIERQFKGHVLRILLLKELVKGRPCIEAIALPDASVREQVLQILNDRQVPEMPDLKPPWEPE